MGWLRPPRNHLPTKSNDITWPQTDVILNITFSPLKWPRHSCTEHALFEPETMRQMPVSELSQIFCYLIFWVTFSIFCISIAQYLRQRCGQRWFFGNHKNVLHLSLPFSGSFYLSLSYTHTLCLFSISLFVKLTLNQFHSIRRFLRYACLSFACRIDSHNRTIQRHITPYCLYHERTRNTHTKPAHVTEEMSYLKRRAAFRLCSFSTQHCFGICRNCIHRERKLLRIKEIFG